MDARTTHLLPWNAGTTSSAPPRRAPTRSTCSGDTAVNAGTLTTPTASLLLARTSSITPDLDSTHATTIAAHDRVPLVPVRTHGRTRAPTRTHTRAHTHPQPRTRSRWVYFQQSPPKPSATDAGLHRRAASVDSSPTSAVAAMTTSFFGLRQSRAKWPRTPQLKHLPMLDFTLRRARHSSSVSRSRSPPCPPDVACPPVS